MPELHFAKSHYISGSEAKKEKYFIVASVELGNSTTKSILTATDLEEGKTYLVKKHVRMTREITVHGEEFGRTITGYPLSRTAVKELVKVCLLQSLMDAQLYVDDLDFVVRSTGVTAGFTDLTEVGEMIKALADGCLDAGVPPRKMTAPLSKKHLPERLQKYSLLDKAPFTGAVASCLPPEAPVVGNEMEGELVTAGIKEGAKWTKADFRNPCMSLDFGTTLSGRVTNDTLPYAKTIGSLCGLAGAIPDAIARGSGEIDPNNGVVLDLEGEGEQADWDAAEQFAEEVHNHIDIRNVPKARKKFGMIPIDPKTASKHAITLIGCDVGKNGSKLTTLTKLGKEITRDYGLPTLYAVFDSVVGGMVQRLVNVAIEAGIVTENTAVGVTGRAGITRRKPELISEKLRELEVPEDALVFVDDGLARGAAVMARCMCGLGAPKRPLGGVRGGGCILKKRMEERGQKRT